MIDLGRFQKVTIEPGKVFEIPGVDGARKFVSEYQLNIHREMHNYWFYFKRRNENGNLVFIRSLSDRHLSKLCETSVELGLLVERHAYRPETTGYGAFS